tara:strand:- start:251 stop:1396 length:1146 start_codon:yes stop_codon:yes gene_type:complete
MGLTREGFIPETYEDIKTRISTRLEAFSAGIDLSIEAPDGQLLEIISFELGQAWSELNLVYNSYNPEVAVGAGLRNIGLITGLPFGAATRSQATVDLIGVAGTVVPIGSIVSDVDGNQFTTSFNAIIPASVQAIATVSGPINVDANALINIVSPVTGWTSITSQTGRIGSRAQTEVEYRNLRNRTVLRNFIAVEEVIRARLMEDLGIGQVTILNNDDPSISLPDGTPPNTIHVTVGEIDPIITDEDIAQIILLTKGLGCPTFGSTSVIVNDEQGNPHTVKFSKAVPQAVFMDIEILFLDPDFAGAEENIKNDLVAHVNSLAADEDVIWSRLFGIITPYSKAQVNVLELSSDGITYTATNLAVGADEYAATTFGSINITVVN